MTDERSGYLWVSSDPGSRWVADGDDGLVASEPAVADALTELLLAAQVGDRVRMPSPPEPPWIVVNRSLGTTLVPRWPGRLLAVRPVVPQDPRERAWREEARSGHTAAWSREIAVEVDAELDAAVLFGPHGSSVTQVVDAAGALVPGQAAVLAAARDPQADELYGRVWDAWALQSLPGGRTDAGGSVRGLLALPEGSPVGDALQLVHRGCKESAIRHRAVWLVGSDPDDDEPEPTMDEPWVTATLALLDAAVALGAHDLVGAEVVSVLLRPWHVLRAEQGLP